MLGPYYKFQITSFLSISSRLTGVFLAVVGAPFAILWMVSVALGPEYYGYMQAFMGSIIGRLLLIACLFALCYHLLNAFRHLMWDTGNWLEMQQIRTTGYIMVVCVAILFVVTYWRAIS